MGRITDWDSKLLERRWQYQLVEEENLRALRCCALKGRTNNSDVRGLQRKRDLINLKDRHAHHWKWWTLVNDKRLLTLIPYGVSNSHIEEKVILQRHI